MEKAAWLARVSDGDLEAAARYRQLAADIKMRKSMIYYGEDVGLLGEHAPVPEEQPERHITTISAAQHADAEAHAQREGAEQQADVVAAAERPPSTIELEARLRALEGLDDDTPPLPPPLPLSVHGDHGDARDDAHTPASPPAAWFSSSQPRSPNSSGGATPRSTRTLPPGGWQPPPQPGRRALYADS